MGIPKHANPTKPRLTGGKWRERDPNTRKIETKGEYDFDVWARAPYNFIPLPEQIVTLDADALGRHDTFQNGRFTGCVVCSLTTKTPLYIRGMANNAGDEAKNNPEFFSVDGFSPRIPGSSLRGMIRAVIEIASYSKMAWVTREPLVYRAVAESETSKESTAVGVHYAQQMRPVNTPAMKPGYVRKIGAEWFIRPAKPLMGSGRTYGMVKKENLNGQTWHNCKNACQVWITGGMVKPYGTVYELEDVTPRNDTDVRSPGKEAAVLFITGRAVGTQNKYNYIFGEPDDGNTNDLHISDELVHRFKDQVSKGQKDILYEEPKAKEANFGALRDWQPVFYLTKNDEHGNKSLIFFGHARYFRLPYVQSPFDLVPPNLRQADKLDLTDALFGYVDRPVEPSAHAGSLSFSDAVFQGRDPWLKLSKSTLTPHILGSPNPTTFQHYLVQDANKGNPSHEPDYKPQLAHFDVFSTETTIRGHKLYWHKQGEVNENTLRARTIPKDTQKTEIKPIAAEKTFEFCIRFENLTDIQLGALLWVIRLPPEHCLKLGMGKPLGMGAVRVDMKGLIITHQRMSEEKDSENKGRYTQLFNSGQTAWELGEVVATEELIANCHNAFEKFICDHMDPAERRTASNLADVPRISTLLKMLEYPGPLPNDWTSYMGIQHLYPYNGHDYEVNEYAKRPVLPDPWHVTPGQCLNHRIASTSVDLRKVQADRPIEEPILGKQPSPPTQAVLPESLRPVGPIKREPKVQQPTIDVVETISRFNDIVEGMVVRAKVLKITGDNYECDIGLGNRLIGRLPKNDPKEKLIEGQEIIVRIRDRARSGNSKLTTKGIRLLDE